MDIDLLVASRHSTRQLQRFLELCDDHDLVPALAADARRFPHVLRRLEEWSIWVAYCELHHDGHGFEDALRNVRALYGELGTDASLSRAFGAWAPGNGPGCERADE